MFNYFLTYIFARTEQKQKQNYKIKDRNLRFWVDELMSLQACELAS